MRHVRGIDAQRSAGLAGRTAEIANRLPDLFQRTRDPRLIAAVAAEVVRADL